MEDPLGGGNGKRKADALADAMNRLLQNLVIKCTRSEGPWDYYDVGVIGYGSDRKIGPAFGGLLADRDLVKLSEVANNPLRVEERTRSEDDGAGGLVERKVKFLVWFEPTAESGTPMCEAFRYAHGVLAQWTSSHPDSYPPTLINLTDGESTDGDPRSVANSIQQLTTNDGNTLVFNLHLSAHPAPPIQYPDSETMLPDDFARKLFAMSSTLPPGLVDAAKNAHFAVNAQSRGFVFNADLVDLIKFLDIGTRPINMR
jgi:hypothetical protein